MQSVSQAWKDNQEKTLVNEGFIKLTYHITDPDALEDAAASDNGCISISNTAQTVSMVDKNIVNYAFLEKSSWTLDRDKKDDSGSVPIRGHRIYRQCAVK